MKKDRGGHSTPRRALVLMSFSSYPDKRQNVEGEGKKRWRPRKEEEGKEILFYLRERADRPPRRGESEQLDKSMQPKKQHRLKGEGFLHCPPCAGGT